MTAFESLAQDVRYATRELCGAPLFSGVAILTLALGIGATTALFSAINAALLRPLPYPNPSQLVDVHTRLVDGRITTGMLSRTELDALNRAHPVVARAAGVGGVVFDTSLVRDDGTAIPIAARGVTAGFFDTLGLPMTLGRSFVAAEYAASGVANDAVVISHHLWSSMFGSSPDIIGRVVRFTQLPGHSTIIGVASPDLDFPRGTDAWLNARAPRTASSPSSHGLSAVIRLRPGASLADLDTVGAIAMAEVARTDEGSVGRA